jgi:LmbE family N-acetylglucosaminyl deacetylase
LGLKLLCVVAHPDDECFAFGGALLLAAEQGVETHVICLTDGQAASNRGATSSGSELGKVRGAEFAASCKVLGVSHHELWDYQDGKLEFAEFSATAARLVATMRELKPDVVLTFGPDGAVNTHPDHSMVSAFTTAAFHWAASAKRYPELGPIHYGQRLFIQSTNFFMEGRPAPMPSPWNVTLDIRHLMARKHEAFCQHASQAPLMEQTKALFEKYGETEHYLLLAMRGTGPAQAMTSLFEGLEAEQK